MENAQYFGGRGALAWLPRRAAGSTGAFDGARFTTKDPSPRCVVVGRTCNASSALCVFSTRCATDCGTSSITSRTKGLVSTSRLVGCVLAGKPRSGVPTCRRAGSLRQLFRTLPIQFPCATSDVKQSGIQSPMPLWDRLSFLGTGQIKEHLDHKRDRYFGTPRPAIGQGWTPFRECSITQVARPNRRNFFNWLSDSYFGLVSSVWFGSSTIFFAPGGAVR